VLELVFEFFLPLLIIYREVVGNMKGISRADTQQLLLLMNKNISKDGVGINSVHTGTNLNMTESEHNSQLHSPKSKSRSSSITSTKVQSVQSLNSPEDKGRGGQSERRVNFNQSYGNDNDDEKSKSLTPVDASQYLQHRPIDIHTSTRQRKASTATEVEVEGRGEGSYFSPSRFMDDSSDNMDTESIRNKGRRRKRTDSKSVFNGSSLIRTRSISGPQPQPQPSQSLNPAINPLSIPKRTSTGTSVTPEALISALTMSMEDNASSLAMVV
jgi:hypothetical protein